MSWTTTFHYKQELKSSYMNNIITGLIKPGIYNIDAAIFTKDETNAADDGIYLRLKKGTTLVFSNGFSVENGKYVRDFSSLGSYLVKCVLDSDTDFQLASPAGVNSDYLNNGVDAPVKFVYAEFIYNADSAGSSEPTFHLAVPDTNESFDHLPNEDLQAGSYSENTSYLILGALIDNKREDTGYSQTTGWNTSGASHWINNHVFTGRAFPEYHGNALRGSGSPLSSIAFAPDYKDVYLTPGQFYYNSILYSIGGNTWKALYGQGQPAVDQPPTSINGYSINGIYANKGDTSYTLNKPILEGNGGKVVADIVFMALKTEYSSSSEPILTDLLTQTATQKILPYRVICNAPAGELNSAKIHDNDTFFGVKYDCVPLDISSSNIERLKGFILNRDIILPVIEAMRQNPDSTPFLDSSVGDSLLPLSISFRKINSGGTDYVDAQSADVTDACNPANVLSFFELQSSSFAVTGASFVAQEVYTLVPFLKD